MEVVVIRSGMMTTVQDLGRRGHLAEGVPVGGAADPFALRVANLLVGNPEGSPAIEVTLTGPELEFPEDTWIAVC
ncbi:MAG TPA: urea amidolyase, partial [Opitutaceae bacterium]